MRLRELSRVPSESTGEIRSYSWTIESESSAYKVLDKSSFINGGSAIPVKIRPFFIKGSMDRGERRSVSLLYKGKKYDAYIKMLEDADIQNPRTQLLWPPDFMDLLAQIYPSFSEAFTSGTKHLGSSKAILRLTRVSGFSEYKVSFNNNKGVVCSIKNPFLRKSWIEQNYSFTDKRQLLLAPLLGERVEAIMRINPENIGRYVAFVSIRWGFASVVEDRLEPTKKWADRLLYDDFGVLLSDIDKNVALSRNIDKSVAHTNSIVDDILKLNN